MTDSAPPPPESSPPVSAPPTARVKHATWPGLVWAIPVAAMLIVAYLGLQAFANQGFDVAVTFDSAGGAHVDDTKVIYKGVDVGEVRKIALNRDGRHVDLTLHLDKTLKPVLGEHSKFWLIGATPSLTDFNSLKAAVSGLTIGLSPVPGPRARHFIGLEHTPLVDPSTPGRTFWLDIGEMAAVHPGASVQYHGQDVGKVIALDPTGPQGFRAQIFIFAPYDAYLKAGSFFWNATPVQISLSGTGVTGQFSPSTVLNGGVAFDTPLVSLSTPPVPTGSHFTLYATEANAQQGPDGPPVLYSTIFHGAAGALQVGAPVLLSGARIGFVETVGLNFDPDSGVISNPVTFVIYPQRLHVPGVDQTAVQDWRVVADRALTGMIRHGYRVSVSQDPPLLGPRNLILVKTSVTGRGGLQTTETYPLVPAATGADAGSLTDKADAILTKLNAIPIAAIGDDVRQVTSRLKSLISSPKIDDSLDHLDKSLRSIDDITADVKPKIGPLIDKLNQTADDLQSAASAANGVMSGTGGRQDANLPAAIEQVTEAARAVKGLADYLQRHPEAVIKGKPKE